jgi:hypothetical protein
MEICGMNKRFNESIKTHHMSQKQQQQQQQMEITGR